MATATATDSVSGGGAFGAFVCLSAAWICRFGIDTCSSGTWRSWLDGELKHGEGQWEGEREVSRSTFLALAVHIQLPTWGLVFCYRPEKSHCNWFLILLCAFCSTLCAAFPIIIMRSLLWHFYQLYLALTTVRECACVCVSAKYVLLSICCVKS